MKPRVAPPYIADQTICPTPLLVVRFVRRYLPLSPHKSSQGDRLALDFPSPGFFGVTLDTGDLRSAILLILLIKFPSEFALEILTLSNADTCT